MIRYSSIFGFLVSVFSTYAMEESVLGAICHSDYKTVLQWLTEYSYERGKVQLVVHNAIENGNYQLLNFLVEVHVDIGFIHDATHYNPIINIIEEMNKSVNSHYYDSTNNLLLYLKCYPELVHKPDSNGLTPLSAAVKNGDIQLCHTLLQMGALVNQRDRKGNNLITQLIMAWNTHSKDFMKNVYTQKHREEMTDRYVAMLEFLVGLGVEVNGVNTKGRSPLWYCLKKGYYPEIVIALCYSGAVISNNLLPLINNRIKAALIARANPGPIPAPVWDMAQVKILQEWYDPYRFEQKRENCLLMRELLSNPAVRQVKINEFFTDMRVRVLKHITQEKSFLYVVNVQRCIQGKRLPN